MAAMFPQSADSLQPGPMTTSAWQGPAGGKVATAESSFSLLSEGKKEVCRRSSKKDKALAKGFRAGEGLSAKSCLGLAGRKPRVPMASHCAHSPESI